MHSGGGMLRVWVQLHSGGVEGLGHRCGGTGELQIANALEE